MSTITPERLLAQSALELSGEVEWNAPVPESGPGVYIITVTNPPSSERRVVYIGRAKSLRRRLRQFYRHKYGATAPHRGGQEILTLAGQKTVYWAQTNAYAEAERAMLEAFKAETGTWPHGNRIRSARMAPTSN